MTHEWHEETVRRGFDELFSHIRSGAVERERARDLPVGIVRELAGRGLGRLRLPHGDGGEGVALPALFAIIEDLAYADSNIAHVFRNHLNFVEQVLLAFRPDRQEPFVRRIAAGEIFAASLENYSGASGSKQSPPSLSPAPDGSLRLKVTQHYSTGNLYADVLSVPVEVGGRRLTAFIPTNAPGVAISDDWRGFGQRLTASGSTVFDEVVAVRRAAYGTAKATSVVQAQSLAAVTELFDATSGTSLSDELGLDRHWRNIRTIANHNPRTYKERLIGRAELTGEPIPAGKAFF